MPSKLPILHQQ